MIRFDKETYEDEERFFQKVDRILTGDVRLSVKKTTDSLAYADIINKNIFLNFEKIKDFANQKTNKRDETIKFIGLAKGFNYHELAHQIFTRHNSVHHLPENRRGMLEILNCLEDGRIETLFSNRYPKAQNYFINCFLKAIYQKRKELNPLMYIPTQSRQIILPSKLRAYFEKAFINAFDETTKKQVDKLIVEYLTSDDSKKQIRIAQKIYDLTKSYDTTNQAHINLSSSSTISLNTSKRGYSKKDKEAIKELSELLDKNPALKQALSNKIKKELEKRKKQQEKIKKKEEEFNKKIQQQIKQETKTEDVLRKKKDKVNEWGDEVRKRTKRGEKEATEREKKLTEEIKELEDKHNKSRAKTSKLIDEKTNIRDKLEELKTQCPCDELIKELEIDEESVEGDIEFDTEGDIKAIYKEIGTHKEAGIGSQEYESDNEDLEIETKHRSISRQIQNTIRLIKNDLKSTHEQGKRTGKINIKRVMNSKKTGDTRVFSKFRQNKLDKTKIGTILLLDKSGSMSGLPFDKAIQSSWVLSDALEKTKNKVCIIEFGEGHNVIKDFNRRGKFKKKNRLEFDRITDSSTALKETQTKIKKFNKIENIKNWIVFILTDGRWNRGSRESEETIKNLNKAGVETILIFFSRSKNTDKNPLNGHFCKHKAIINDVDELSKVMKETIGKIEKNIRTKLIREGY